jgi:hypothetical protein
MKHAVEVAERVPGTYWHAAAILKLELDPIVRVPLEELRFEVGGGAITRRVDAQVGPLIGGPEALTVPLHWKAAERPNLFPVMDGELRISDCGDRQIDLRLLGEYATPLGAVGAAADAVAGRRVAQNSLHRFLADVAQRLEASVVEHAARAGVEP